MKNIFFTAILFSVISHSQTTTIDFETLNDGYTVSATEGSGYTDVFNRYDGSSYSGGDIGGNTSFVWALEDLSITNPTMNLSQIDISGSTSFTFSIDMLAHHYNDWDASDELLITYSLDGGAYQNLMWVQNTGQQYNSPASLDTDFDGDGDCGPLTTLPSLIPGTADSCTVSDSDFKTFVTSSIILDNNDTLDIKLQFNGLTSADEGIYLDNIVVTESSGTPSPTVSFDNSSSSETETDATFSTNIPVTLTNYSSEVTVGVAIDGSSTAETSDYSLNTTSLIFDNNESNNISLDINSDDDSDDETIILNITISSGTADLGTSQHILTIIDDDLPSVSIPYSEDFSDCDTQNWTVFTVGAQQEWTCGGGYFEANAYGSTGAADDYLVSPEFNMDAQSGETLSFTSWTQYADTTYPRIELLYTTNFTGDVSTTTWNSSLSPTFSSENSQAETESGDVDISGLTGTSVVFAFRYTSSGTGAGSTSIWRVDNISIAIPVTWQGDDPTTPNDWSIAANWDTNSVPTSTDNVVIPDVPNALIITNSTAASCNDLSLNANSSLTINTEGSLTVGGTLTNNGSIVMQSSSSSSAALIATSISGSGTYKYQKYVAGSTTNDLITAPFSGETFSNLVGNNSGVLVQNTSPTTEYLFGPFDNDTGEYLTYDSTTNASTVLSAGQGYRAGTTSGATLEFTGTFQTTDQTVAINVGEHETYGKWNLVGNPFPSYLDLDGFLDDNNTGVLENVNTAVYAYDGDDSNGGSNWTIYSLNETSNVKIAPGQAFFVASSDGVGNNLVFNTSRQTVTGGDDFLQRQTQTLDSFFKLKLQSNNSLTHTDFYFNSNAGEGLDIGYDVGTYANLASSFSLYSKLASGEYSETNFAIQAISNDLSETVVIPLGVHTSAGENHSISIEDVSILESINVYLKDYETGTLTLLNNGAYSFSTDNTLEGISRFELRLTNTTLGIESDELVTNFKAVYQNDAVILVGDFMLEDKVEIYDIMGRLTQSHTISGNHFIEITKDELATGVYLAKINREGNSKTIKFIIN